MWENRSAQACVTVLAVAGLAGCVFVPTERHNGAEDRIDAAAAPDPEAPRLAALPTRHFGDVLPNQEVLGAVQVLFTRYENTFVEIARRYNVGYDELRDSNPSVDVWLPGEGTPVYLPTMTVIPDAPREGIVLNLPSMRLMYFAADEGDATEQAPTLTVTSHPIGIGREGWATPTGTATVTDKARDPTWYPPASVRAEHAELGDPLPSIVPPGPDNPLGQYALGLSMPGYLIHGTNKPAGVGMRVSHGCIRLYPEDIEALFDRIDTGTPVTIVDQPVLAGWRDGELYLEVHEPLAEDTRDLVEEAERVIAAALHRANVVDAPIDREAVARIVAERRGIPFPVLATTATLEQYLASSRIIENTVPVSNVATTASR